MNKVQEWREIKKEYRNIVNGIIRKRGNKFMNFYI